MSDPMDRDQLPLRADMLPPEWCDHCGCFHDGVSREDYDAIIALRVQALLRALGYGDRPMRKFDS